MNSVPQHFTMPPDLSIAINEWIEKQPSLPRPDGEPQPMSRPEAIRRLLALALALASQRQRDEEERQSKKQTPDGPD